MLTKLVLSGAASITGNVQVPSGSGSSGGSYATGTVSGGLIQRDGRRLHRDYAHQEHKRTVTTTTTSSSTTATITSGTNLEPSSLPPSVTAGTDRSLVFTTERPFAAYPAPICAPYPKEGICILSAGFFPASSAGEPAVNTFLLSDGYCNIDHSSGKSLDAENLRASDHSLSSSLMTYPLDIMSVVDPKHPENGFRFSYGGRYEDKDAYVKWNATDDGSQMHSSSIPSSQHLPIQVNTQSECWQANNLNRMGKCYSVAFECDAEKVAEWKTVEPDHKEDLRRKLE